jgi:hypothetical protein
MFTYEGNSFDLTKQKYSTHITGIRGKVASQAKLKLPGAFYTAYSNKKCCKNCRLDAGGDVITPSTNDNIHNIHVIMKTIPFV